LNAAALAIYSQYFPNLHPTCLLLFAACTAGAITSFTVAPIERVKVMMQASKKYKNEIECVRAILNVEGWSGLLLRGIGPTLAREIPSYGLYFWVYGFLTSWTDLGPATPLVFGASAGMASWLPVYPIDVVKTLIQNTSGEEGSVSAWTVMHDLYAQGGIGSFFDGLTPKLMRAAVNHAVTFYVYDTLMSTFLRNGIGTTA
jgi:hypothetical protein